MTLFKITWRLRLLYFFSIDLALAVFNVAGMKFFTHALGMAGTNFYLFVDEESSKAVLFDAPEQTFELLEQAKKEMPFEFGSALPDPWTLGPHVGCLEIFGGGYPRLWTQG